MKLKHLIIFILLAIVISGLAYWTTRLQKNSTPSIIGEKVFPELSINNVKKIVITSAGSTITVAKAEKTWTVPDRYNYPANFDKVAGTMRDISELKIGQVVTVAKDQLGSLHLLSPVAKEKVSQNKSDKTGTLLELMDGRDNILACLLIGKTFIRQTAKKNAGRFMTSGGYADGQYVRIPYGKVYLVSTTLGRLTENIKTWLDDTLINIRKSDIQEITVTGPGRTPIKLTRDPKSDNLSLDDISENEECNTFEINQMANALQYLSFDDVVSPALTPKETGLDHPVIFTARTKKNQVYTFQIGETTTNTESADRCVHVTVEYAPRSTKTQPSTEKRDTHDQALQKGQIEENTRTLNAKLSPWTHMIKSYRADSMLLKRENLIKKKEKPGDNGQTKTR